MPDELSGTPQPRKVPLETGPSHQQTCQVLTGEKTHAREGQRECMIFLSGTKAMVGEGGRGAWRTQLLLALVIRSLTTHPFRDGKRGSRHLFVLVCPCVSAA